MNTMNLTKRPLGAFPETSEQMVNLICINALDQCGIEHDKAEHWESKYYEIRKLIDDLEKFTEIGRYSDGSIFISFNTISEKYDTEIFDNVASLMKLGKKIIEFEANEEGTK